MMLEVLDRGPDKLERNDDEDEDESEDFAGAAARQPFLEPGEQHAAEEKVHGGKDKQNDQSPTEHGGTSDAEADPHREEPDKRGDRAGIEQSIDEAQCKKTAEAKRKSKQVGKIELHANGSGENRINLPEEKNDPHQSS